MDHKEQPVFIDDRLFKETGVEARLAEMIVPTLHSLGFRLVRITLSSLNGQTLQIMAERPNGQMSIEDCEKVSRTIAPILEVEDPILQQYHLEVSSPGIDRPLVRKSDFLTWQNSLAKIETTELVDGRKRFRGKICEVNDNDFTIKTDKSSYEGQEDAKIAFSQLENARLILTDELIRAALRHEKALNNPKSTKI